MYRLQRFFKDIGHPISYPTLMQRFKDQQWTYMQGYILRELGIWDEPLIIMTDDQIAYLYRDERIDKPGPNIDVDHVVLMDDPDAPIQVTVKR